VGLKIFGKFDIIGVVTEDSDGRNL